MAEENDENIDFDSNAVLQPQFDKPININEFTNPNFETYLNTEPINFEEPDQTPNLFTDVEKLTISATRVSTFLEIGASETFADCKQKMTNVTNDGKVMKYVQREGQDPTPGDNMAVLVHYEGHLECADEPFDSTFLRNKPDRFRLDSGRLLPGFELAIKSMKLGEMAFFLVEPEYAFGKHGCLKRIPPNATILYYIELLRIFDETVANVDNETSRDVTGPRNFQHALQSARGLSSRAKVEFEKLQYRAAVQLYHRAATQLEYARLADINEQNEQVRELVRVYTNLAVCYNKIDKPKMACTCCNKIYNFTLNDRELRVPEKVYFHNGKALHMIGELELALKKLLKAKSLNPGSRDILNEIAIVYEKIASEKEKEKRMAMALVDVPGSAKQNDEPVQVDEQFKNVITEELSRFMEGPEEEYHFPIALMVSEVKYAEEICQKFKLKFNKHTDLNGVKYYVSK